MGRRLTGFGEKIELAQRAKAMSDSDLASAVGVSSQTIFRWKRNKNKPHKVLLGKLIEVLGLKNT